MNFDLLQLGTPLIFTTTFDIVYHMQVENTLVMNNNNM